MVESNRPLYTAYFFNEKETADFDQLIQDKICVDCVHFNDGKCQLDCCKLEIKKRGCV